MKQKLIRLSRRYVMALEKHLKLASRMSLRPAPGLGRQTLALGLETLDLARIHEQALVTLRLPGHSFGTKAVMTKRAGIFFSAANFPIEETHQAACQAKAHLGLLKETLGQRTEELAVSNRQLQQGVRRHKVMEEAFAKSGRRHNKCLEESLELQQHLRQLTHQVIAAQEDERAKISHELQDEIVQTLVGINVRLLNLKQKARTNTNGLKNQIASTQRLVVKSAKSVRKFAHELDTQP